MNAAHFHLILNHVPVITTFFAIILMLWGYLANKRDLINVAFWGFILAALATIPVFLSGHSAEEIVENMQDVSGNAIDLHEEMAEITLWLTIFMGILGITGLYMQNKLSKLFKSFLMVIVVFGVVTGGLLTYTGYLGGHIHHPEIVSQSGNPNTATGTEMSRENDD